VTCQCCDVEGGSEIIEDCRTHVKLEGRMLPGQVYVSKPGQLPCKVVIHAVGPMWRGGKRDEENQLYAAVSQSIEEATQRGFQTIAIPAISAGIFGFPPDRATEIILSASRDHFTDRRGTCLKEIHIVDKDPRVISLFESSLKSMTLPTEPGPEEGHSEPAVRRVRAHKNVQQTGNADGEQLCYYWPT